MKPNHILRCLSALVLTGVVVGLNFGCGKKPAGETTPASAPKIVSAEKTSFSEVTSQLDPGGNFYLYLGTAQWLDGLSAKVDSWRSVALGLPNVAPSDAKNI